MRTKLFTTNSFFVMIMTLVLAVGVQGIADALSFTSQITRTDRPNVSFVYPNQTFDLRFTVGLESSTAVNPNTTAGSATDISYASGSSTRSLVSVTLITDTGYTAGDTHYTLSATTDTTTTAGISLTTQTRTWTSDSTEAGARRGSATDISHASGTTPRRPVTATRTVDAGYTAGETHYTLSTATEESTITGVRLTTHTRTWMTEAEAYHYNEEAVTITPGSNISIISINGYAVNGSAGAVYELNEDENWGGTTTSELSQTTITVKCQAGGSTTVGQTNNTVAVSDTTPAADYPNGASDTATPPTSSPFQITVVHRIPAAADIPTLSLVSAASVIRAHETRTPITATLTGTNANSYEVDFAIASGSSGTLSEKQDGTGKTGRSLTAYTAATGTATATVYLNPSRSTTKVQVTVAGRSPGSTDPEHSRTVTVFYQSFNLEADLTLDGPGGNGQSGVISTRLANPFVVKVTDGTNRGISGQVVRFTPDSGNPGSGNVLFPHSDFRAEPVRTGGTQGSATNGYNPLEVRTDRSGEAKVYFELGNDTGTYTVAATFSGITRTFTATALSATTTRVLRIDTENSVQEQSVARLTTASKPLVVRVLAGGVSELSGQPVRFTTADGDLSPRREAMQLQDTASTPPIPDLPTDRTIETNARGEAWIDYTAGNTEGPVTIYARAYAHTPSTSFSRIDSANTVIFRVNVGGSTTNQQNQNQNQNQNQQNQGQPTLTVDQTSITGRPGSTQTLRISASQTAQVGNFLDRFLEAGGSVSPTSSSGTFTATLTLPSAEGEYPLTVSIGNLTRTVTVTASRTAATETPTGSTLRIRSITPGSGAPGTQATVTVQTTDADGDPASSVPVTLRITSGGGTLNPSSVTTNSQGIAVSILTFGSTPGNTYFITATADGYNFEGPASGERVTITGAPQETDTPPADTPPADTPARDASPASTAGDPSLISIDGESTRSGTINQELDDPLVVEVLDSQGARVNNARVIFRVQTGQGRLSQRGNGRAIAAETNAQGRARADYTPMSARSTVEAEVRGVTETVTFTIITDGSAPPGTSDGATRSYKVRDEIPISLEGTLTFRGSRTLNGIAYTCVGSGECVVSFGTVTRGQIQAAPAKAPPQQEYKVRDEIPISLEDTLTFRGQHAVNGTIYTCVGPGECVVSFGTVVKGQIRVSAASAAPPPTTDISLKVSASERPVMYWIAGRALYRQAAGEATLIAESAKDVVVDTAGGKLYYIEQTSERSGAIHTANLDGDPNPRVVKTLTAAPQGLAFDGANQKLYLTNGWGKIQRMNVNGTQYEANFITGLTDPMHIAVADGHVYWTEGQNSVRAVNLTGAKVPRNIVTGAGTLTGLAAGRNKVFWAEQTDLNRARIRSANPDGTGMAIVYAVTASVYGLALDPANNQRLYWTNGWGKVQRGLSPSRYQDVVTGLVNTTAIAIGKANPKDAVDTPKTATTNKYDINGDGTVDNKDVDTLIVAISGGVTSAKYDVNSDGKVDFNDIVAVRANRNGGAAGAPTLLGRKFSALEVERLQEQIDLLIATGDRSPAAMQTLIYLQQLIVMARPEKTQLLANFPNPFNPETWMPYELATDTDVRITIYNAQGVVIRVLHLGQQSAGYYTDRERAAYWDGKNASGEQVASGVYFYQLETDDMSSLRKMVILK